MPSEVDNVILGDVSLLYDSNLSIKNYEVQDKNGIKVIRIQLDGTQTDYNNSVIFMVYCKIYEKINEKILSSAIDKSI